jgi:hypothetical protein
MHLADEPYGRFPGYRAFGADGATVIGWAPQVFEYLGKSNQPNDPAQATFIEVLICPSDQGPKDTPRLNYVVNGGQAGLDSPADGVFFDHAKDAKVYITKDDFRDGLTNTILLAENLDATEWNVTDEESQCILWPLVAGNEVNNGVGGAENVARPSSHHPGGFVAAFADGSVKFMSEADINDDPAAYSDGSYYVSLLTPGGNDAPDTTVTPDPTSDPSGSEPCGDLANGLAARWTFNDTGDWYGAEVGTDGVPQSFNFTHETSERDGVLYCPGGPDDWVSIGNTLNPEVSSYTVSAWFRIDPADSSRRHRVVTKGQEGTTKPGLMLRHGTGGSTNAFKFTVSDTAERDRSAQDNTGAAGSGQWTHVVGVIDRENNERRLYVNGQPADEGQGGTLPPGTITTNRPFVLAGEGINADWPGLRGWLDDVRVYTRALEVCEIEALYNSGDGLPQDGVE